MAVDGELYVWAYNGLISRWYQAAIEQEAGRIQAAGMVKNVSFESISGLLNDRIYDAYQATYQGSP
ncbi:DUF2255 family protein [Spirosoma aerolatum]|uniref:DUF2255 family protein n=1 Tax=Spirosoma aerolatum TaxID=1211326 RepID=UPI001C54F1FF|nr:DUF2255 family protein [Spirosoma aerolatum]